MYGLLTRSVVSLYRIAQTNNGYWIPEEAQPFTTIYAPLPSTLLLNLGFARPVEKIAIASQGIEYNQTHRDITVTQRSFRRPRIPLEFGEYYGSLRTTFYFYPWDFREWNTKMRREIEILRTLKDRFLTRYICDIPGIIPPWLEVNIFQILTQKKSAFSGRERLYSAIITVNDEEKRTLADPYNAKFLVAERINNLLYNSRITHPIRLLKESRKLTKRKCRKGQKQNGVKKERALFKV